MKHVREFFSRVYVSLRMQGYLKVEASEVNLADVISSVV